MDRPIVDEIIGTIMRFGMGNKKMKWTDDLAKELHRPVVKRILKRRVRVNGIDKIWAADMVDMHSFVVYFSFKALYVKYDTRVEIDSSRKPLLYHSLTIPAEVKVE